MRVPCKGTVANARMIPIRDPDDPEATYKLPVEKYRYFTTLYLTALTSLRQPRRLFASGGGLMTARLLMHGGD